MPFKDYWFNKMILEAVSKSTMNWLIMDASWIGQPHPLWQACRGSPNAIEAATTRARLLIGRFGLQAERAKFSGNPVDSTCQLCRSTIEDTIHFVVCCPKLQEERLLLVERLCSMYTDEGLRPPQNNTEMCYAVLNGWGYITQHNSNTPTYILNGLHTSVIKIISLKKNLTIANRICSSLCHRLRIERDIQLYDLSL